MGYKTQDGLNLPEVKSSQSEMVFFPMFAQYFAPLDGLTVRMRINGINLQLLYCAKIRTTTSFMAVSLEL
jgi:hypothetical protein